MYQGSIINHKCLWGYGINFHSSTKKEALQVSENMNKKNRSIIRAIIITLSVFAGIIVSLSFCLMKHLMGVSKEKTEAEARAFHNIDESWQSIQATMMCLGHAVFSCRQKQSFLFDLLQAQRIIKRVFFQDWRYDKRNKQRMCAIRF